MQHAPGIELEHEITTLEHSDALTIPGGLAGNQKRESCASCCQDGESDVGDEKRYLKNETST